MTKREFIDDINDFYDLIDFCNQHGCYECEDIVDDDEYDDMVDDDLHESAGDDSWRQIRDWLADLPTGYDFYLRRGMFDFVGIDYEFEEYKSRVLDWADSEGVWDDDEEEEDDEEDDDDDLDFEESDISMEDMMKAGFAQASAILAQDAAKSQMQARAFEELLAPQF